MTPADRLPAAAWRDDPDLARLFAALGPGQARIVGGAVRDTLLGLAVADLDVATRLPPERSRERIAAAGFKAVPTGIAHGTVTALLPSGPVEVTTLRRDVETDGRHAIVAFTDDWREDAARRDFTMNALSADLPGGEIHDYFDGLADLAAGRVRFIGAPLARIAEDHLRILRFFRFHARFGRGAADAAGLAACTARANDLMALSRERIAQELLKLLGTADPAPTVATMIDHGIFRPILPEITADGLARLRALIGHEGEDGDAVRRLAALLPRDPAVAQKVALRLKLSKAQVKRLAAAAAPPPDAPARAIAYRQGLTTATDLLLLAGRADELAALADWQPPRLPIAGGALIALGLRAGPEVAAALARIERRWLAEGFPDEARVRVIAAEEVRGR